MAAYGLCAVGRVVENSCAEDLGPGLGVSSRALSVRPGSYPAEDTERTHRVSETGSRPDANPECFRVFGTPAETSQIMKEILGRSLGL